MDSMKPSPPSRRTTAVGLLLALALGACNGVNHEAATGRSTLVLLADRLDAVTAETGTAPASARAERSWTFPADADVWRPFSSPEIPYLASVAVEPIDDAVRLSLGSPAMRQSMLLMGGLKIDLEGLRLGDWETVLVRARSSDRFAGMTVSHNLADRASLPNDLGFFFTTGDVPPIFNDGSEQVYALPIAPREGETEDSDLESLGLVFAGPGPAQVDVLSISMVPRGASFLDDYGVRPVSRDGITNTSLFAHTPASLSFRVDVPAGARLDFALTSTPGTSMTYRVAAGPTEDGSDELFSTTISDSGSWSDHSVDLADLAGTSQHLTLTAESDREGEVAIWGMPMISSSAESSRPNVIFYVIDGAGADLMSVYGYERPTTPFLEELAREGAIFERAYSNSSWTQPSTVSFLTSLHHSVLGGLRRGVHSTAVPTGAVTMAEHLRAGGYQNYSLTSNPNSGRLIGTERGVDSMWDTGTESHSTSSVDLHERFWYLREHYPGTPWAVHFQTTDVHEPNHPEAPFAGRYTEEGARQRLRMWDQRFFMQAGASFGATSVRGFYDLALERTGIDRQAYFEIRRGLYDETMNHQDHQLSNLVERLKEAGEWDNTLLIIGADHGHPAGTFARFGRGLLDPQPEPWQGALFDAYATRVPLIIIWPGGIEAGQRFEEPVSMIDVLPTLLDLLDLPAPEMLQGQSLAPLLRGERMRVRPVILDEFRVDARTGEMVGNIEIVDGRWGATLEIGPGPDGTEPESGRHEVPVGGRWGAVHPWFEGVPRLLLYDLENDPFATRAVNEEHPELVERYLKILTEQWEAHQALATRFGDAGDVPLSPEQLQELRALGYIQ